MAEETFSEHWKTGFYAAIIYLFKSDECLINRFCPLKMKKYKKWVKKCNLKDYESNSLLGGDIIREDRGNRETSSFSHFENKEASHRIHFTSS